MYLQRDYGKLFYEIYGEGEPLLLIHGVIVDAELYEQTAKILSRYYQVICYDRRGYSRSKCEECPEFHMEDQAEDILGLLDALGIEKVTIAGASAGAVIGQYFLQEYPERVRHLIMYEPAMIGHMLREDIEFRNWVTETSHLIERKKYNMVLLRFSEHIGSPDPRSPKKSEKVSLRELDNVEYAFTKEVPGLLQYQPDLEKMHEKADRITLAVGERSGNTVYVQETYRLAEQIEKHVVIYPGGHNLPYDLPLEFAICVLGTLKITAD
ncbi:alpha/beta fold hydrolase [Faecalicatena contorta]|uniref:alpha/beta fold hydrolase n=1 Tax=Lachnospiraceae TaxID=186803 RepID=UPI001F20C9A7|nr:alpha/beta hydrolase [Faecalicatena contorta]MCF2667886.1 alpha/beta hydrolase [Faecalicatena contorta]